MPLKKGKSNSGITNLIPFKFKKGISGYSFKERIVKCEHCKCDYKTKAPFTKYCSISCKEKCRPDRQKKDFICEFCSVPFKRRAPNNVGRFCSRRCSGMWTTANGKYNYFYKAFLYYPHYCNQCKINDFSVLVVHHKDENHSNNEITNLEILCANCHYRIHYGNGATRYKKIDSILDYLNRRKKDAVA